MHPHLIDWLGSIHIQSDATLASSRWAAAEKVEDELDRASVARLLGLFLYADPPPDDTKWLSSKLLVHDPLFPVSHNTEEVRLMAGVIMVQSFTSESRAADAFALGLRAASFPSARIEPAHGAILREAENYLRAESERQRPDTFGVEIESPQRVIAAAHKNMREQEALFATDQAKIQAAQTAYHRTLSNAITGSHENLAMQIRRIAEESSMLWWVLGEFSETLNRSTSSLQGTEYALIAAQEAANRTQILPPPQSMRALLARAIQSCKSSSKRRTIDEYLNATPPEWRTAISKLMNVNDVPRIVPISLSVGKCVESGDAATAVKIMVHQCPGISESWSLTPLEVAQQLYNELIFLKALDCLEAD